MGSIVRGPLLGGAAGTKVQGCTVGIPSCFLGRRPFGGGVRGPCHWIGDLVAPGGGRGRPAWTLRPYHCTLDPPVRGMRIHASTVGTLRVFAPVARAATTYISYTIPCPNIILVGSTMTINDLIVFLLYLYINHYLTIKINLFVFITAIIILYIHIH